MPENKDNSAMNAHETHEQMLKILQEAGEQNPDCPEGQFLLNCLTGMNEARNKAKARVVDPVSVKQINGLKKLFEGIDGVNVDVDISAFRDCFMFTAESSHIITLDAEQIANFYPLLEHSTNFQAGYDEVTETHCLEIDFPHYVYEW